MLEREAEQLLEWLTGCFGKRLDDNERAVWLSNLVELDATKSMQVALQIGKSGERFPTVPDFRRIVRSASVSGDESWRDLPPEALPIPEFTQVWWWSIMTHRGAHRPFPQFIPLPKGAMSIAEYEEVRQQWIAAGSPSIKSVSDILGNIG